MQELNQQQNEPLTLEYLEAQSKILIQEWVTIEEKLKAGQTENDK